MRSFLISTPSRSFIPVIKSRRMRWMGHVARVGRGELNTRFLEERSEGKNTTWKT